MSILPSRKDDPKSEVESNGSQHGLSSRGRSASCSCGVWGRTGPHQPIEDQARQPEENQYISITLFASHFNWASYLHKAC